MTRKEQIQKAAYYNNYELTEPAFIAGAEWADNNPYPLVGAPNVELLLHLSKLEQKIKNYEQILNICLNRFQIASEKLTQNYEWLRFHMDESKK